MNNYIDNGDGYEFRDKWLVDNYLDTYNDAFEDGSLRSLNRYVVKVTKEWYRDSYSRFLQAAEDLMAWMRCDVRSFAPSLYQEIDNAYDKAIKAGNADAVWIALFRYLQSSPSKVRHSARP